MSRSHTSSLLDQYELAIDEIVAACDGDVRGALRALMLVNEQLEQRLERISGHMDDHSPTDCFTNWPIMCARIERTSDNFSSQRLALAQDARPEQK